MSQRWLVRLAIMALVAGLLPGRESLAQSFGGGNSGSSGFGSNSGSSGLSSGSSGFGGSSGGSSSGSSGGLFGNRSVGGGVSAGNRTLTGGANGIANANSSAGILNGNERFVRGNRQNGTFVGGDSKTTTDFLSALGTNGQNGNNLQNLRPNQANRQNQNQNQQANTGRQIRTTIKAGFEPPVVSNVQVADGVQKRLNKSPQIKTRQPIEVELSGRVAILRGVVATAHDRDLAERVALLEPGISQVQNDLVVPAPTPAAAAPRNPGR